MQQYHVLGLDLDNTLHDYRGASDAAMGAVFSYIEDEYGVDPVEQKIAYSKILKEAQEVGFAAPKTSTEYRSERFEKLLLTFSILPGYDLANMLTIYSDALDKHLRLNPGAIELLRYAKSHNIRTVVVTEGPHDAQKHTIEALGIAEYIDDLVSASEEGVGKTDGLFSCALNRTNCAGENMIYIGDSIERDIKPTKEVGIPSVLYYTQGELGIGQRNISWVTSLDRMINLLFK
ncbi:MAG: HAD family hydrolase [Candidatus Thiodiazotropha sp.]